MTKLFFNILYLTLFYNIYISEANNPSLIQIEENTVDIKNGDLNVDSAYLSNVGLLENKDKVLKFYKNRNYKTAWFASQRVKEQGKQLINQVRKADEQGLIISKYPAAELDKLEKMILQEQYNNVQDQENKIRQLDVSMTDLFFEYARHVNLGLLQPEDANFGYYVNQKEEKSILLLEKILSSNNVDPFQELEPKHPFYNSLKNKLAEYRNIKKGGGWPVITEVELLEKGDSTEVVIKLRERLRITGDLRVRDSENNYLYDEKVAAAVEHFQKRHGLKVDSVVGPQTLEQLNVSVDDRIDQILINMEKVRWLPEDMGNPHLMVNIPEFMLYVNEGDKTAMKMKVITGKVVNATVIFSDSIEYLEMSPYWNIPYSISTEEILPQVKGNPKYLANNHYEVLDGNQILNPYNIDWHNYGVGYFPYRLRQTPGLHNSLGTIKFIFPNRFSIYLHDTPAKSLFDQSDRDFSHGCIRVEQPLELGSYLLANNPEWDEQRIEEYRSKNVPERVHLKEKVPVYILYFTAFVDEDGTMNFREDIYSHDDELTEKFFSSTY